MTRTPDFEGALADIFNAYDLTDSHLYLDRDFRADFARHVMSELVMMGIGMMVIGEDLTARKERHGEQLRYRDFKIQLEPK